MHAPNVQRNDRVEILDWRRNFLDAGFPIAGVEWEGYEKLWHGAKDEN